MIEKPSLKNLELSNKIGYILSFLGDLTIGLLNFSMSLYADILSTNLNYSENLKIFWVGLIATGFGLTYLISPVILGYTSDKIGRKISLQIATIGMLFNFLYVIFFSNTPIQLFFSNLFNGVLFGLFFPVITAYLSEIGVYLDIHDENISKFMVSWSIGLTLGPLVGGLFDWNYPQVAFIFLAANSILMFFFITIFFLSKSKLNYCFKSSANIKSTIIKNNNNNNNKTEEFRPENKIKFKKSYKKFFFFGILFGSLIFSFNNQILFTIFPSYAKNYLILGGLFNKLEKEFVIGILIFAIGVGRTVSFYLTGKIPSREKEIFLVFALFGMAIMMFLIFILDSAFILIFIMLIYGFSSGFAFSIGNLLLLNLSNKGKGLKSGLYESAVGIGFFMSTFFSQYIGQINPSYPYLMGSIVSIISFIFLLFLYKKRE